MADKGLGGKFNRKITAITMASNKTLTVFTPTYNRAYILPKLYESLCRQSCDDFVWSIVDDGSTDNTEDLVRGWIDDNEIEIKYLKQENGGKMRAHNRGIERCDTPLFVCVDSDDYMTDTAVEEILDFWQKNYRGEENICGMIAYRYMTDDNNIPNIVKRFPPVSSCTMHSLMKKYNHQGETVIILRTEVFEKFPFPEIAGEKFITEAFVYDQIDQTYKILLCDKAFVVCKYLPDGYTCSRTSIYKHAPKGWAMYFNQQCNLWHKENSFKEQIKAITYYIIMSDAAGEKGIYKNCTDKSYRYFLAKIASYIYKRKLRHIFY